jgi:hypothetical protein
MIMESGIVSVGIADVLVVSKGTSKKTDLWATVAADLEGDYPINADP